jgi:hypothetical protein
MAEPAEVARRLEEFIRKVQGNAGSGTPRVDMSWVRPNPPGLTPRRAGAPLPKSIYERCVDELTDDERDGLDRMIEKMNQAMPDPPDAIQP